MISGTGYAPSITCRSRKRFRRSVTFRFSFNMASSHKERMCPLIWYCWKVGMYCSSRIISNNLKTCRENVSVMIIQTTRKLQRGTGNSKGLYRTRAPSHFSHFISLRLTPKRKWVHPVPNFKSPLIIGASLSEPYISVRVGEKNLCVPCHIGSKCIIVLAIMIYLNVLTSYI